jgi:hypothetical protein
MQPQKKRLAREREEKRPEEEAKMSKKEKKTRSRLKMLSACLTYLEMRSIGLPMKLEAGEEQALWQQS